MVNAKWIFLQENGTFSVFQGYNEGIFFCSYVDGFLWFFFSNKLESILCHLHSLGSVHTSSFRGGEHGWCRGQYGNHGYRSTLPF